MTTDQQLPMRRRSLGNLWSAPYPPSAVANFFLSKSDEITQMQLHKLLYYAHGWYLAVVGKPLLNEMIGAWKHGPVVPSLYYDLKKFGARPVDRLAKVIDRTTRLRLAPRIEESDHLVRSLLERVWIVYGGRKLSPRSEFRFAYYNANYVENDAPLFFSTAASDRQRLQTDVIFKF